LIPVLFTFYIQGVLKLKKNNNSGAKSLKLLGLKPKFVIFALFVIVEIKTVFCIVQLCMYVCDCLFFFTVVQFQSRSDYATNGSANSECPIWWQCLLAPEFFFLILAHPVHKMWTIQEPNTLELWNKLHFEEEKKRRLYTMFKIFVE